MIAALLLAQLVAVDRVALAGRTIHVADVVAGSRSRAVVAELPRTTREVSLSRRAVAALVARRGVTPALGGSGAIRFVQAVSARQAVPYEAARPAVAKDAPLEVVTLVGPVRITRSVTAMENGRTGARLFVRDADGRVFAAAVPQALR